ncbi:hypothetical protein SAMN02745883_00321 [Caminicella sporogenes DSM 14501]|uniref:Uncharacterized protein n=1 Tax=Caminicella sporogenes DSM 14501 TaxID=1121266 RepID=A0A1M6LRQ6_9FIRM|nr:hypothetical protein [Caminicella sporogenes]RKD27929.1 hypothetical protein BET04_02390 [Caminicella sporogenes]SHJ73928.1 hypothetical protein SAMN02745883_00321 [Caminicella sporogenes DSM 14501]
MKKIIIYFIILLILTTSLLIKYNENSIIQVVAYSLVSSIEPTITNKLLKNYNSNNPDVKKKAENTIKEICLNSLKYENWKKYIDYIDLNIYFSNIIPNDKKELIINLNLSKDRAVICIFTENNGNYIFYDKIENLLPIENIKFIKIPNKNYNFLITYQIADERLGAYYYEKFIEIYMYKNKYFKKLWKETLFSEEIFRSNLIDKNAKADEWTKNIIKNNIDFIKNSTLEIIVSGIKKTFKAQNKNSIPPANQFKLVDTDTYKNKYYWNQEFENFSIFKDVVLFHNKPVIVIKDSNFRGQTVHTFFKNKYKILTISDKIIYINKSDIHLNID